MRLEVWTRPGDPAFGMRIDGPPARVASLHDAVNQVGDGGMSLPNTYDRFDDILKLNRVLPSSSVSSLVRVRNDDDTIAFEWLPDSIVPASSKQDPEVEVGGRGIKSITGYAVTEPYDWDGSADWACSACDWIWGGQNLLGNPGFEESAVTPTAYELLIYGTAGTYTLSDGTDTTSAIAFNALAGTIQTEIESDITALPDVIVADAGVGPPLVKLITYSTPAFGPTLTVDGSGLTPDGDGRTAELILSQQGGLSPSPWTRASALAVGINTNITGYTRFEVTDEEAHTGTYSLAINPGASTATANRWLGAQQVLNVTPGQTYQASVWIRPVSTGGSDLYRLSIMGVGEEIIATNDWDGVLLTPAAWNQITIPDVIIPAGVSRIIFRVQNVNPGPYNPVTFYVDDGEFTEGLPPATPGEIIGRLYAHAVDPALRTPIVWDDGSATDTPYLTLGFTDSLDSGANAWAATDISIRVYVRMTMKQVLDQLATTYGIEWEVAIDDEEAGTWILNIYNPGGMDTAPDVAIHGSSADVQRRIRRFLPFTDYVVEGALRVTGRAFNAYQAALGRMETARLDRTVLSAVEAGIAADQDAVDGEAVMDAVSYQLNGGQLIPLQSFRLGDTVAIDDPPEVEDTPTRFWEIYGTLSVEGDDFTCEFLL